MAKITVTDKDIKAIEKDSENKAGKFINESCIVETTLKLVSESVTSNGATQIAFSFGEDDTDEPTGTIYGCTILNIDGSENFGMNILKSLMIINGIESMEEPEIESHKFGDKTVDLKVYQELKDIPVVVRILRSYSRYNGKNSINGISESLDVKGFYRPGDYATSSEITQDKPFGEKYAKDMEYASSDYLKDGITEEEAAAYRAGAKAKRQGKAVPAAQTTSTQTKTNPFQKRG
jgi:hypothetical protein